MLANCKINLGLHIVSKRADGYHNIETIFYPIPLADEVIIEPANELQLHEAGILVGEDMEKNLVIKAYRLLQKDFNLPPVSITLTKHVPFGAGLGGGSSDASHTLLQLNEMFQLGLSQEQLATYAAKLGADCAFFIYNKPMMATGIGTEFSPVDLSLKGYYLALVKPSVFVSTADAYRMVKPCEPLFSLQNLTATPITAWKNVLINQFEESVFAQYPIIADVKQRLYDAGAVYASMSGSGSSVFGIFAEKPTLPTYPDCEAQFVFLI
jgi:4-diphosphocytidyl-2-C-methyl-D-erythritol kinase